MAARGTVNTGREDDLLDAYFSSQDSTSSSDRKKVCVYFLKGCCKFGDECWFLHSNVNGINFISEPWNNEQVVESTSPVARHDAINNVVKGTVRTENNLQNVDFSRDVAAISCGPESPNWVYAPEFVPKSNRSYSAALRSNNGVIESEQQKLGMEYCMHFYEGVCPTDHCPCIHGDYCELCFRWCLDPSNELQRNRHMEQCEKEMVQNMEYSFAVHNSEQKTCGICMDVIMEKPLSERVFGILENCNHVFCLSCIRKWRSIETYEVAQDVERLVNPEVTRSCPECRISSHFITPSRYYVESGNEKRKLISEYKLALSKRPCKYFRQGAGICPFGGACFYLHANPDGTKVVLPMPAKRRMQNQDGELNYVEDFSLWDFLEVREGFD